MSGWNIRQFEKTDIDAVMAINQSCLPENYPKEFFLGLHYSAPKAFIVAESNNEVVGYIMCRIERGVSLFEMMPIKKGHIVSVAVKSENRRQGIGSALVTAGMQGMREYGAREFYLEVRKTNHAAISVYEHLGFEIRRVLKSYYRDGEDAYLMVRDGRIPIEERVNSE